MEHAILTVKQKSEMTVLSFMHIQMNVTKTFKKISGFLSKMHFQMNIIKLHNYMVLFMKQRVHSLKKSLQLKYYLCKTIRTTWNTSFCFPQLLVLYVIETVITVVNEKDSVSLKPKYIVVL